MFRFTIRDLLWLIVVVGMLISWPLDHWRLSNAHRFVSKDRERWRTRATFLKVMLKDTGDSQPAYDVECTNYARTGFKMLEIELPVLSEKERAEVSSDKIEP